MRSNTWLSVDEKLAAIDAELAIAESDNAAIYYTRFFTDPQNNGPFIYKSDGDSFVFYGKGPNGIDEGGSSSRPADDWPIWPLKVKIIPAGEQ